MDATAWTAFGATVAILVAIGTSFRSLRGELRDGMRALNARIDAEGEELRRRIDAEGETLRKRIDAQGEQIGRLRERMARLEGLLEGLREAITGKRVA